MIKYADLGATKQLSEIVFAGSHEAGITSGGGNAQTQDLDIGGQARAGARSFDADSFEETVPINVDLMSFSFGGTLKMFMPNVVILDFAHDIKCGYIHGLNTVAATKLVTAAKVLNGLL